MKKHLLFLIPLLLSRSLFAQITYLDLTGLSTGVPIINRSLGTTGLLFNASVSNIGTPSGPFVTNSGNFSFYMPSDIDFQSFTITLVNGSAPFVIERNTHSGHGIFESSDSVVINRTTYDLTDPLSKINVGVAEPGSIFLIPTEDVSSYSWNIQFSPGNTITVSGGRRPGNPGTSNLRLPLRIGIATNLIVLPVDLSFFSAESKEDNSVLLRWGSKSESNTDRFKVERSIDGTNWEFVQDIRAAGNSSINRDYAYKDFPPVRGRIYYRLAIVDLDGSQSFSRILLVEKKCQDDVFRIMENPIRNNTLRIRHNYHEHTQELRILTTTGKISMSGKLNRNSNETVVDISHLPAGLYYLSAGNNTKTFLKR